MINLNDTLYFNNAPHNYDHLQIIHNFMNINLNSHLNSNSNKLFVPTQVQQNSSQYGKQTANDRMQGY